MEFQLVLHRHNLTRLTRKQTGPPTRTASAQFGRGKKTGQRQLPCLRDTQKRVQHPIKTIHCQPETFWSGHRVYEMPQPMEPPHTAAQQMSPTYSCATPLGDADVYRKTPTHNSAK